MRLCYRLVAIFAVLWSRGVDCFGHNLLTEFQMAPGYVNLNHGSYGATPRAVTAARHKWYDVMELRPDYWFRYNASHNDTLYGALDGVRARIAKYINAASPADVVFVDNASGGAPRIRAKISAVGSADSVLVNRRNQRGAAVHPPQPEQPHPLLEFSLRHGENDDQVRP